ncbi:hypothetical protein RQP46_007873 [Phenoliferia psychrophenolica]
MATLPEEIITLIVTCLLERDPEAEKRWPHPVFETCVSPLDAVGAAVCLASRRLLPHGRRILYERLETRDGDTKSWRHRVLHLEKHPHLAGFLRECPLELDYVLSLDDVTGILNLINSCPNFHTFAILDFDYPPFEDPNIPHSVEALDQKRYDLRCIVLAGLPASLRHLDVQASRSRFGWDSTLALLERSTSLESLTLISTYPTQDTLPIPSTLDLPRLLHLTTSTCDDDLVQALLVAAPNLVHLTRTPLDAVSSPLTKPHLNLTSLSVQVVVPPTRSDNPDAYLLALSTFISSFPSLTTLFVLLIVKTPFDPSPTGSVAFLTTLPPTLINLFLCGPALLSTSFALTPLLSCPPFTNLRHLTTFWGHPAPKLRRSRYTALLDACAAANIGVEGTLLRLKDKLVRIGMADQRCEEGALARQALEQKLASLQEENEELVTAGQPVVPPDEFQVNAARLLKSWDDLPALNISEDEAEEDDGLGL